MCDAQAEKTCPRCYGTHVVKNGHRQGQQQYRCESIGCRYQFTDRPNAPGHRFSAEVIATAIGLHLLGRPYEKIAADVQSLFSISDTSIPGRTVYSWVEKYIDIAAEEVRKLPVRAAGPWMVEHAYMDPVEGRCWVVQDSVSSYILAAQAGDSFDPAVAAELIQRFEASIGNLSENLHLLIFATREDFGDSEAIEQRFPFGDYIPSKDVLVVHKPDSIFGLTGVFWYPLQIMRKRKAFRNPESRQRFLDGWVVMLNFFIEHAEPEGCTEHDELGGYTPAMGVGVEAPFRSWLDVVNYRA